MQTPQYSSKAGRGPVGLISCNVCGCGVKSLIKPPDSGFIGQMSTLPCIPPRYILHAYEPLDMCKTCVERLEQCSFEDCINKVFRPGGRMIKCKTHAETGRNLAQEFEEARLPCGTHSAAGAAAGAGDVCEPDVTADGGESAADPTGSAGNVGSFGYIFIF